MNKKGTFLFVFVLRDFKGEKKLQYVILLDVLEKTIP
jgi:hypothetical protein